MKLKKRRKSGRFRGSRMHGRSAKKSKGKGNRGGKGMSGTGKKAGQRKSIVEKYLLPYFGGKGLTSRSSERFVNNVINIGEIENRFNAGEVKLSGYKILGNGEIKKKFIIQADSCSESAREKIEKAGGKIILPEVKEDKEKENKIEKERSENKNRK